MPTVVDIYCRVSTDPQEDNTSLDEQEAVCRQFCRDNNLVVGMTHREIWSGFVYREREKLDLMRERYRSGKIMGVVVRTFDRLSRRQAHAAVLMEEMEHHNVTFHCVREPVHTEDKAIDQFVRNTLAFVAEMEREKIMDRTITGRVNKAKQGLIVSGSKAPYGYDWLYDELGGKTVVINETQADVVRYIFEEYAKGVACWAIMQKLNAQGVPGRREGYEWSDVGVLHILTDRRYTGTGAMLFNRKHRVTKNPLDPVELPDGTYPRLISDELFAIASERRKSNQAQAVRASREPEQYLLRAGFVKCAHCDYGMMAVKHRKQYTYRCFHTELGHTNVILASKLDPEVWAWLEKLSNHIELIEQAVDLASSNDLLEHDIAALEYSISGWKAKAANYLADLDDGSLVGESRAAIRNSMNHANTMVQKLEEEKSLLLAGMIDKNREREAYKDILAWCKKVKGSREELTYQQKRDFLKMLGVRVVVNNVKPFYENLKYRIEIALPTIGELISEAGRVNSDTPSEEDIDVTYQLAEAGKLLDIELLDHIIIGNPLYVSLKEKLNW